MSLYGTNEAELDEYMYAWCKHGGINWGASYSTRWYTING